MTEGAPRIHIPIPLRWGDQDAFGHVNNATIFTLLEEARVRALFEPASELSEYPSAVVSAGIDAEVLTLIARQEIEYLAPIPYQAAPIDVQLWFSRMGGASLQVDYEVYSPRGEEPPLLCVRASSSVVMVDPETYRPVRLSDRMRDAWQPYLGEPVVFRRR